MKGQLTIEYMLTFVTFIALMMFIYFQYSSNIPSFVVEIDKENRRSEAYQVSELLLNDPGQPVDWEELSNILDTDRIGLSSDIENKRNLLDLEKIEDVGTICSNYQDFQDRIVSNKPFILYFNSIDNLGNRNRIISCGPPTTLRKKTELNTTIRRIAAFYDYNDGGIKLGELIIEV